MEYTTLGATGTTVSRIALGCNSFGSDAEWMLDEAECRGIIERALDLGMNFFDTADVYSYGESERILGEVLGEHDRRVGHDGVEVDAALGLAADARVVPEGHVRDTEPLLALREVVGEPRGRVRPERELDEVVRVARSGREQFPEFVGLPSALDSRRAPRPDGEFDGIVGPAEAVHRVIEDDPSLGDSLDRRGDGESRREVGEAVVVEEPVERDRRPALETRLQVGARGGGHARRVGGSERPTDERRRLAHGGEVGGHRSPGHHLGGDPAEDEHPRAGVGRLPTGAGVGQRVLVGREHDVGPAHRGGDCRRRLLAVAVRRGITRRTAAAPAVRLALAGARPKSAAPGSTTTSTSSPGSTASGSSTTRRAGRASSRSIIPTMEPGGRKRGRWSPGSVRRRAGFCRPRRCGRT